MGIRIRRAEEDKSFWKRIALETVKAISVMAFVGGGIYLLMYLKEMQ